ncbi:MAG: hypothetical protein LBB68_06130 [Treponema sp.]|nr:hypothetical protein [Treponema sp.]
MIAFVLFLCYGRVFAQEDDDIPYLSDEDIASIEISLPDDIPENLSKNIQDVVVEEERSGEANEISRLNISQPIYHLLILDRRNSPFNSDIRSADGMMIHLLTLNH